MSPGSMADVDEIVVFGITGNLSRTKLVAALGQLWHISRFSPATNFWGFGRRGLDDTALRQLLTEAAPAAEDHFIRRWHYIQGQVGEGAAYQKLAGQLVAQATRLVYLAVGPDLFEPIVDELLAGGVVRPGTADRLMIEKPFGLDATSAQRLNHRLTDRLAKSQIYRMDHYLGKAALRRWLSRPTKEVQRVEFVSKRTDGIDDGRRYFSTAGIVRDVVQNHALETIAAVLAAQTVKKTTASARANELKKMRLVNFSVSRYRDDSTVPTAAELTLHSGKRTLHIRVGYQANRNQNELVVDGEAVSLNDPPGELSPHAVLIDEALSGQKDWFVSFAETVAAWRLVAPLLVVKSIPIRQNV